MLQFHVITNLKFYTDVTGRARFEQDMTGMFRSLDMYHNGKIEPNEIDESVETSLKQKNINLNMNTKI